MYSYDFVHLSSLLIKPTHRMSAWPLARGLLRHFNRYEASIVYSNACGLVTDGRTSGSA